MINALTVPRHEWTQPSPRYESIPTSDVYESLFRLFPRCDQYDLGFYVRAIMSAAFDIWAIDNRLKDPYIPHYPPAYEPVTKMEQYRTPGYIDRVIDSVVWGDIDLVNLMSENRVQYNALGNQLTRLAQRFESFYPPTQYDSLLDIQMSVVHWYLKDMVILIRT